MHRPLPDFLVGSALVLSGMAGFALGAPGDTELISARLPGQTSGGGREVRMSANGVYAGFASDAADLVPGDTNSRRDIFLRNLQTGAIERISLSSAGNQADGDSYDPAISGDGRYVVFRSNATNLAPGDSNGSIDVFVRDRETGQTKRVSVATGGAQANNFSWQATISGDGHYVAFSSGATNLVPGDVNGDFDVFVHDRETYQTELVSVDSSGTQGNLGAARPSISANGRYVAFESRADNLVVNDGNGKSDVFVRDRETGETSLVSVNSTGVQAAGFSRDASISADGQLVAFRSDASNLVPEDANGHYDIFVRDRQTEETELVSVTFSGSQADGYSLSPRISGDGRFVAFESAATDLVPGDDNGRTDIFLRDRQSGQTELVSLLEADGASSDPSLSADGRLVAFGSHASLVPGFSNGHAFVVDREAHTVVVASVAMLYSDAAGDSGVDGHRNVSADGRYVAFWSYASDLVPGDSNGQNDIFVRDRQTGEIERVSVDSSGGQADSYSFAPSLSADGRFVAFWSNASTLVPDDGNGQPDIFVHDRQTGQTERVSVDSSGLQADSYSFSPTLSGDGRFVAFQSSAANLVPEDSNGHSDIFVRDRQTSQTEWVSVNSAGAQANGFSSDPSISIDGLYVAFSSSATNLAPGDSNAHHDVFVRDRQTARTERVNVSSSGAQANSGSYQPSISSDGRYVTFWSYASNLVSADGNGLPDIFVRDRQALQTERASVNSSGVQGNRYSNRPSSSGDGRYVAFWSYASNLVTGDSNDDYDVFVRDRAGQTELVSVNSSGGQANHASEQPSISADGRFVVFGSLANNLVATDLNSSGDVYVHERGASGATPMYTLSPTSLNFGNQAKATTSAAISVQMTNTGGVALPINSTALSGTDAGQFSRTTNCGSSLAAGASCQINVTFTPASNGTKTATLTVSAGAGAGSKTVALSGVGVTTSFTLTPTSLNFGNQARNTSSAPRLVTLTNTGAASLPITSRIISGSHAEMFSKSTTCGSTLAVGGNCTISVVFRPTGTGNKTATLTVRAGGGAANRTVSLSGRGT